MAPPIQTLNGTDRPIHTVMPISKAAIREVITRAMAPDPKTMISERLMTIMGKCRK